VVAVVVVVVVVAVAAAFEIQVIPTTMIQLSAGQ
jgi:hypothetical protein